MEELWQAISDINSFSDFWEWFKLQALWLQIFIGVILLAILHEIVIHVFTLIPFGDD